MAKTFTKSILFVWFIIGFEVNSFGQDSLPYSDSTSFFQFLKLQDNIPSLKFRYKLNPNSDTSEILGDSTLNFTEDGNGNWTSAAFENYSNWYQAGEEYLERDSAQLTPDFLIYEEPSNLEATQDYVDNLWRNKDIFIPEEDLEIGNSLVLLANEIPYKPIIDQFRFFTDYKLVIVISLIGIFLVLATVMILFMIIIKTQQSNRETRISAFENQIIGPLSELLFEKSIEEIEQMSTEEIYQIFPEKDFKRKLFKQALIVKIISLNKKMKGEFKEKLKALYKKFGLDVVSINKLKSRQWAEVTKGLVQTNEMDLIEALPLIKNLTNSSNFYIRSQAIATQLSLSEKVDLTTLKNQTYPLSRWQQMNYLRIIKYLHIQKSLKIETLFESENQSIRLFSYKLIRLLGRIDLLEKLASLAPEVDDVEKIEILKTYQIIGFHNESAFVNQCLRSENPDLRKAAANAAGIIGDQASAHILIELLQDTSSFHLKMLYLDNLQKIDSELFQQVVGQSPDEDYKRIHTHLLDPLLQNV
ncbi:ligand-binding sensor domain-containing protein [Algoriphagus machipongonensis]|uniref:HEAT repeat domain-containing protein n=1 Tax=Algoriphagus machipongonensis TaxID=388413 RepID=A3HSN3_9BACT|nr:hypothetical protein [Algoriphagus machipongonensis]EAZ82851.1 hypothetical protein ALPR1_11560 [Algoriphagus machipongonensis]